MFDDKYKAEVIECLKNSGWVVTQDPYHVRKHGYNFYVDLEVVSENGEKRLVEIKSFHKKFLENWYNSIGKMFTYQKALNEAGNTNDLYLAVPVSAYRKHFQKPFIKNIVEELNIKLVVYNLKSKKITFFI